MKIGIVSIFDNNNFGNRLQNYAMQQVLKRNANEVITIKNKPSSNGKSKLLRLLPLAESPLLNKLIGKPRRAIMAKFTNQYVKYGKKCYWYENDYQDLSLADRCDAYCIGSDQVWNPNFGRFGMFSYGGFAPSEKIFAYSASFGIDKIPEKYVEDVKKGLEHIKYISVREDAGKKIVEELTGRTDVQVLVDPTMLLTADEWDEIAEKPQSNVPERYLLTYFLGEVSDKRKQTINEKASSLGCKIINLMDKNGPFYVSGPSEFVYLIKNATLVCTDSFHGSVFSFLYNRPLMIFDRLGSGSNMGSRLQTLAGKFCLQDNLVKGETLPDISLTPDYTAGYAVLEDERKKSKAYLDMVLKNEG